MCVMHVIHGCFLLSIIGAYLNHIDRGDYIAPAERKDGGTEASVTLEHRYMRRLEVFNFLPPPSKGG